MPQSVVDILAKNQSTQTRPRCFSHTSPILLPRFGGFLSRNRSKTYARQLGAAVTALGGSAGLLDVKDTVGAAGSLDDAGPVGGGVVAGGGKERNRQSGLSFRAT